MTDIVCTDPDHDARSGERGWSAVLGTTDQDTAPTGVRCAACVAHDPPPSAPPAPSDEIAAARASLAAATTIAQVRTRTVALFDLLTTTGDTP